jgi:hypothetical protein
MEDSERETDGRTAVPVAAPVHSDPIILIEPWGLEPCGHRNSEASRKRLEHIMDSHGGGTHWQGQYSRPTLTAQLTQIFNGNGLQ